MLCTGVRAYKNNITVIQSGLKLCFMQRITYIAYTLDLRGLFFHLREWLESKNLRSLMVCIV